MSCAPYTFHRNNEKSMYSKEISAANWFVLAFLFSFSITISLKGGKDVLDDLLKNEEKLLLCPPVQELFSN
jgi:hypothetical protein